MYVSADTEAWLGNHRSIKVNVHAEPQTATPAVKERIQPLKRKLMETVGERLNSCWRLDLHLTLAVVHYAAAVMITFVWSFFLSSPAAAAWQRAPDTRLHGCCSVWHITTEEHTGMRRRTRQEWMSTMGKAEEMTNKRQKNKWQQFWRNYRPVC